MKTINHLTSRILEFVGAACLLLILILVFIDVFARYLFNKPMGSFPEVIAFAMGITIFSVLPLVTRDRSHITASLMEKKFTGIGRYLQRLVILVYTLGFSLFLSYLLYTQAEVMRLTSYISEYLEIPFAPFIYVFTGLSFFSFLLFFPVIWKYFRDGGDPEDKPKTSPH